MLHIHEIHYRELCEKAKESVEAIVENTKQFDTQTRYLVIGQNMVDLVMRELGVTLEYDSSIVPLKLRDDN